MAKRPEVRAKLEAIAARTGVTVPWDRITINRWRPDTCPSPPCTVEQWFDDDDPSTVLWAETTSLCSAHATAAQDEALWNTIRGENVRKNQTLGSAIALASLGEQHGITWEYDDATRLADGQERLIIVTVPGINTQMQSQIQAAADLRFGPGVVTIDRG